MKPFLPTAGRLVLLTGLLLIACCMPAAALAENRVSLIERYQRALAVDPHNSTLRYQLGVALLAENQPQPAIENFQSAYPAYVDSLEMNYNLGLAYAKTGDPDSAVLYFEQAEALGALGRPARYPLEDAYFNLALTYLQNDLLREAEQLLNKVLSINPDRIAVHHALGKLYSLSGQTDKAFAAYQLYLTAKPGDQPVRDFLYASYYNRGLKKLAAQEYAQARADFNRALRITADDARARYSLAHIDLLQGDPVAAIDQLKRLYPQADAELRDNIRMVIFNSSLALLQRNQGRDPDLAEQAVRTLLDETPEDPEILFLAGNIALSRSQFDQARERYEALLDIDPGHQGALTNLSIARKGAVRELLSRGRTLLQAHAYRSALTAFETALTIDPAAPDAAGLAAVAAAELDRETAALFNRAEQALATGELKRALECSRKGLDNRPDDPRGRALEAAALDQLQAEIEARLAAGNRALQQNDPDQAQLAYARVLELDAANPAGIAGIARISGLRRDQAESFVKEAEQALRKGDLPGAATSYRQALKLQAGRPDALAGLERTLAQIEATIAGELRQAERSRRAGAIDSARSHLQKALALGPNREIRQKLATLDADLKQRLAKLMADAVTALAREEFAAAENLYQRVLSLDAQHAGAQSALAQLAAARAGAIDRYLQQAEEALQSRDHAAALTRYRKVLQLQPTNRAALDGLQQSKRQAAQRLETLLSEADAALGEDRFAEAESAYRKVVELDPYHAGAAAALERMENARRQGLRAGDQQQLYLAGIRLYTTGRYQEAIARWQQVLLLVPDHEKARLNIDKAQRKLRMLKERRK